MLYRRRLRLGWLVDKKRWDAFSIKGAAMILALMIVAIILLILASFNVPTGPINIGWLGLAFWASSTIWNQV